MSSAAQKELASSAYWDKRYAEEKSSGVEKGEDEYEWFRAFAKLKPFLERHIPPVQNDPKILHLGCGKSVCESSAACK